MGMSQEHNRRNRLRGVSEQMRAQQSPSGTAIEDDTLAGLGFCFHARSIAAEADGTRTRCRY